MFKISKKFMLKEVSFVGAILLMMIFSRNLYISIFCVFISLVFARDIYNNYYTTYEILEDKLVKKIKDKEKVVINYSDLEYVTKTRKHPKWYILMKKDDTFFNIKPEIENHKQLIKDLILMNVNNNQLIVHELIPGECNIDIQLKKNGKIKR